MKLVPLIPSGASGPLGIKHLPRLWLKASLAAQDKLHPDYSAIGRGFDRMTLEALAIEPDTFMAFIRQSRPSYPELEAWVLKTKGPALSPAAIAALNRRIDHSLHHDETRTQILDGLGIEDDGSIQNASSLNNLDDWGLFHREFLA